MTTIRGRVRTGLYIHIPFCVSKCNYCSFLSFAVSEEEKESYVHALISEIESRGDESDICDTIYFGGGTPSLLDAKQIGRILEAVRKTYRVDNDPEITLEANPATVTEEKLRGYRTEGINRLSFGVQSMDDRLLKKLGRIHTSEDVRRDMKAARKAGFENISLDQIFAIPGSTLEEALRDTREIAAMRPEHLSFYSLQLEEGTPFFTMFSEGSLNEVPDDIDRKMYHRGCEILEDAGYEHYEISNFAKPGRRSGHNSKYWNMSEYIGFGLGASSYVGGSRMVNVSDIGEYERLALRGSKSFADVHRNTERDEIGEAVFTGLRRIEGISFHDILGSKEKFFEYYNKEIGEIRSFEESGHLIVDDDGMRLTREGIDISNRIMEIFV